MGLETALIGEREHLVVDTGGIADAEHVDATVYELLGNPVDSHVTLRTDQHLTLPPQRLIDGLHEGRCLTRAWRTVNHRHVLCLQHFVDGLFLCGIQIRKSHGREAERLGLLAGIEEVSQITQPPLGLHHTVERFEHRLIARLVEEQLDAHVLCPLHVYQMPVVRHSHHHTVSVDIADGSRKVEILNLILVVNAEKGHGPPELEVVFYLVVVTLPEHLHHQLVQRVIVAPAHLQRIPCITALHLPLQTHLLGLLAKGLLLSLILQLEQQSLLLKRQYRRVLLISHELAAKIIFFLDISTKET